MLGKFAFRGKDQVNNMEEYISSVIRQLTPLYEELK
ncbi:HI_0552 family protein [Limosilactobacillus reuteri]